ncbi:MULTISPECIES: TetR/AcrR family transcriptional regulator [Streptomyces]|uniref:TetR/AcrR family transcriptional regulator n=1 Tax=Streptomyces lycii TaxID=2654337 RepID=A0ABQ7FGA5_9ACTN|nr:MULTISPECIES: TetR/AcrR family transcriptional regulator [Streptomyces]KAF4408076.1 TetR/AcrR family transcriptional regulator [Streptomyces lycii]PGH48103.1 TetR family transcriptional regulator [Streptomyces sp. Ru87]
MARPASALRGLILESAAQLFAAHGYEGTSLHDIASAVGCSKASLLYHFASKETILTELLTPAGAELAELDAALAGLDGDEAAEAAVPGYVDLALRFRRETKILLADIPGMTCHPALGSIPDIVDRLLDALAGRSADTADVVAAHMVLGAVFVTCASDLELPDQDLRPELIRSALRTLGREPG